MMRTLLVVAIILGIVSCQNNAARETFATDSTTIATGASLFNRNCSGCHNFYSSGIGPQLSGITANQSPQWLRAFIRDPAALVSSGDAHTKQLFAQYKTTMPGFPALQPGDIDALLAYLNAPGQQTAKAKTAARGISNPIPASIPPSGIVANLELLATAPASADSGKTPLARITKVAQEPVTGTIFIVDLRGKLYKLQRNKLVPFMDIRKLRPAFIDEPGLATGFGSFAFHPAFARNGIFYTTHTEAPGTAKADFGYPDSIKVTVQWVLTEWKMSNPRADSFSGTGRELLRINMVSGIHGMQEISFNPRSRKGDADYGLLYMGVGDGGAVENGYPLLVHNKSKVWGTVLRIDPAGNTANNKKYGIPPANPFANDTPKTTVREIYAFGFRNPHRLSWSTSGKLLVSHIGQRHIEAVDWVKPGEDYAWPIREGHFLINPGESLEEVFPLPPNDEANCIAYPIAEYDHDEGVAICGGYEYESGNVPALKGKFVFGDIPSGRLFFFDMRDVDAGKQAVIHEWKVAINNIPTTLADLCKDKRVDLHFGIDAHGELYILTKADGKIYRLAGAATPH